MNLAGQSTLYPGQKATATMQGMVTSTMSDAEHATASLRTANAHEPGRASPRQNARPGNAAGEPTDARIARYTLGIGALPRRRPFTPCPGAGDRTASRKPWIPQPTTIRRRRRAHSGYQVREPGLPENEPKAGTAPPLNGIWLSSYQYESTGRGGIFRNAHYANGSSTARNCKSGPCQALRRASC